MPIIAVLAALGAAMLWAVCALLSHGPAKVLGAFQFTRVQMVSAAVVLAVLVALSGSWSSIDWAFWPAILFSTVIGLLGANLATVACLRRGGPRREQILRALNAPFAALLGFVFLGEILSGATLVGGVLIMAGIILAILYGHRRGENQTGFEEVKGPLAVVILLGVLSALCNAAGLVALKPVLLAGVDPLAITLLRTGGSAIVILAIGLVPNRFTRSEERGNGRALLAAMVPGFLGYIVAANLLLFALRSYDTGVVVVLASAAPVLLLPLLWMTTRRRPPMLAWLGAVLAVGGAGIILLG